MSDLEPSLKRLARRLAGPAATISQVHRLTGGASMETWSLVLGGPGGEEGVILRRRAGSSVTHPTEAGQPVGLPLEALVIQAAADAGAPAPQVLHVCDDLDGLGEGYIMRKVEGETLGRKIVGDARFDGVRPGLARQCGKVLAQIHAATLPVDVELRVSDALGELDKYEAKYLESEARKPVFDLAFAYLRRHGPPPLPAKLVHGDFRNGNLMIDPEVGLAAVLDWEMAHLGDPAEDLGWLCVNSWRFGRAEHPVGGFGQYEDLMEGYAEAGGQDLSLDRLLYWQALGSLKWGVICLSLHLTYARGEPGASFERAMIGRRVSETETDILRILEPVL
jgi:aminoglycoside phosphotransferase (APT) family kinase protein